MKTTLEGEPATLIANLEMTSRNYNTAIETLKDRFGDKHRIIEAHYRKLLSLEPKSENYQHLKDFFDKLELHVRGLEGQNKRKDEFGDLLTMILMDTLSANLKCCLARDHRKVTWTLEEFLKALKREIQVMELNDFSKKEQLDVQANIHTASFYTEQSNLQQVTSKTNSFSKQNKQKCPFCNECHRPQECQKYTTITSKLEIAKKKVMFQLFEKTR